MHYLKSFVLVREFVTLKAFKRYNIYINATIQGQRDLEYNVLFLY